MAFQAVIFDLDGVLVSTDEFHYQAWQKLANQEGFYFDRAINEKLRGVSRMESLEIMLKSSQKQYTEEEKQVLAEVKNNDYRLLLNQLSSKDILPGVMDFVRLLKEKNIRLSIGSSSKNAPAILDKTGLTDHFDTIIDGNHIRKSKPDPEVFLLAASRQGVSPESCLVIEDADAGVEAAVKAGMKVLAVGSASANPKASYSAASLEHAAQKFSHLF